MTKSNIRDRRAWLNYLLVAFMALTVSACKPEPLTISWNPVDYEQLIYEMENPTGPLTIVGTGGVQGELEDALGLEDGQLEEFVRTVEIIAAQISIAKKIINDSENGGNVVIGGDGDETIEGTQVYVKFSCYGLNPDEPVLDFTSGTMFMEGATFALSQVIEEGLVLSGHMFLSFDECQLIDYAIRGDSPGFIDSVTGDLALDLNVDVEPAGDSSILVHVPMIMGDTGFHLLVDAGETGTYVLGLEIGGATSVTLGTQEGDFTCSFIDSLLTCIEPY